MIVQKTDVKQYSLTRESCPMLDDVAQTGDYMQISSGFEL